jgi:hypothetical protein
LGFAPDKRHQLAQINEAVNLTSKLAGWREAAFVWRGNA